MARNPMPSGIAVTAGHRGERTARAASSRAAPGSPPGAGPAGRRAPTSTAHWLAAVTCGTSTGRSPGASASAAQSRRAAVAGWSPRAATGAAVVDVGVTRTRSAVSATISRQRRCSTSWSGPCAAPRVCRSTESIRSMSAGRALADLLDDRERGPVDGAAQEHLRVQREPGQPVAAQPPAGPTTPTSIPRRQPRPCCSAALEQRRPMPRPCRPGRTAYVARHHSRARGRTTSRTRPARSRPRRPSSRRGRCARKCAVRVDPAPARARRCGARGAGQDGRCIRASSSWNASSLSRSAAGDVVGGHRADRSGSATRGHRRGRGRMAACGFWWRPTSSPAPSPRSRRPTAIAEGWRRQAPDDELDLAPMADGGPGFVDVLHAALGGELLASRSAARSASRRRRRSCCAATRRTSRAPRRAAST